MTHIIILEGLICELDLNFSVKIDWRFQLRLLLVFSVVTVDIFISFFLKIYFYWLFLIKNRPKINWCSNSSIIRIMIRSNCINVYSYSSHWVNISVWNLYSAHPSSLRVRKIQKILFPVSFRSSVGGYLNLSTCEIFAFLKSVTPFIPQQDSIASYQIFKMSTVRYRTRRCHVTNLLLLMAKDISISLLWFFFRLNYFKMIKCEKLCTIIQHSYGIFLNKST